MIDLERTALQGWRILVVEDEPDNADLVWRIFRYFGAQVTVVQNGSDALHQLESSEFTMVVCDISLPVFDGWALIRQIREHRSSTLPVIALTAHAMFGDRERAFEAGFSGYLTKPISDAFGFVRYLLEVAGQ